MAGCLDIVQFLHAYLHPAYHCVATCPEKEAEICTFAWLLWSTSVRTMSYENASDCSHDSWLATQSHDNRASSLAPASAYLSIKQEYTITIESYQLSWTCWRQSAANEFLLVFFTGRLQKRNRRGEEIVKELRWSRPAPRRRLRCSAARTPSPPTSLRRNPLQAKSPPHWIESH